MPTNVLEGMPEKSLSDHFTTNVWSSLNATGTLTGTVFFGQMKQKFCFLTTLVGLDVQKRPVT